MVKENPKLYLVEGVEFTEQEVKVAIKDCQEYIDKCEANGRGQASSVEIVKTRLEAFKKAVKK